MTKHLNPNQEVYKVTRCPHIKNQDITRLFFQDFHIKHLLKKDFKIRGLDDSVHQEHKILPTCRLHEVINTSKLKKS